MQKILDAIKIIDVYVCLTGFQPKATGDNRYRGRATWRAGDGLNISLDNNRGVWHDFVANEGGGILDLIARIRGGSRRDALVWAAEFSGISLESKDFTDEEKAEWIRAREALGKQLPDALYWQRAAVNMAEDALVGMKANLFDSTAIGPFQSDDIYALERILSRLRHLEGQRLVDEFEWWQERYPATTNAMIRAAKDQVAKNERTLRNYIRYGQSGN